HSGSGVLENAQEKRNSRVEQAQRFHPLAVGTSPNPLRPREWLNHIDTQENFCVLGVFARARLKNFQLQK
ncbi:MAG: hypothetical protein KDI35_09055, partial [Gammaproteobacteria bacterium]|nr:hypothetical protein [Gammaproteobacteria bacterium]